MADTTGPRETSPARLYLDSIRILKAVADLRDQTIADAVSDLLEASTDPLVKGARELAQQAAQTIGSAGKKKGTDGGKK
jgi:hypothetical protein